MKKTLELIVKILTKKNIKIVLMLFILLWLFFSQTYAADTSNIDKISETMKSLLSILSWLWIILASIAGKFMVNDMMYWWFLHLDTTLWSLRNVIKNFANFVLWFMLIWTVLKNLFKAWDASEPLKIIKKSVIAWVLIQMSRFLLWAVVDISTIATSAIWAFPSQFMTENNEYSNNIRQKLTNIENKTIVFDPKEKFEDMLVVQPKEWQSINTEDDVDNVIDTIMPTYDSVWWPLIFIWAAFFDLLDVDYNGYSSRSDMFIDVWTGFILTILYTLMMFFLFLFNFLRMVTLWIVIPAMPFVILGTVFEVKVLDNVWWWFFKIWNIFKLIFKPVLMVWALSLLFIIMMFIKWVMWANWSVHFSDTATTFESTSDGSWKYNSSIHVDWLLNLNLDWAKNSIADLVVYILWMCLMFFLVWTAIWSKSWIKFIDDTIEWLSKNIKDYLGSVPIIPLWWWKRIWFNKMKDTINNDVLWNEKLFVNKAGINVDEQTQAVLDKLWVGESRATLASATNVDDFAQQAKSIADGNRWDKNSLENEINYKNARKTFIDKHKNSNRGISGDLDDALEKVFEQSKQSEPAASNQESSAATKTQ